MINESIAKGVAYLREKQKKDGSFLSHSSYSTGFKKFEEHNSPFYTSLILSCLNNTKPTATVLGIGKKAAAFLLSQKSKNWSFNYWVRGSKESQAMPYPDDLDDTFCALSALFQHDPKLIGGDVLANAVELLTLLEIQVGGPYKTWLVPKDSDKVWKDIDIAVNSNIAFFLSLVAADLPNITRLIEKSIKKKTLISPYYFTNIPVIYFISRFYKGKMCRDLADIIMSQQTSKNGWGNPLSTALAVSALINMFPSENVVSKRTIDILLASQKEGAWKAYPLVIESKKSGKTLYAGSSCLTTAFCLEALSQYAEVVKSAKPQFSYRDSQAIKMRRKILDEAGKHFSQVSDEVNHNAQKILADIARMDEKNSITLLPYIFREALGNDISVMSDQLIISLGIANLYGWIAYTIYDDFLDNEAEPQMLPIANIALREATRIFCDITSTSKGFEKLFNSIMDKIETANAWEISNCRMVIADGEIDIKSFKFPKFGNYSVLAHKSLGHALGPLAILFSLGFTEKSLESKHLLAFFTYYLIARQLNDDAHDWEEDLEKGHITPVGALLLKKIALENKISRKKYAKLLPQLQQIFWDETIVDVCRIIENNLKKARKTLKNMSFIADSNILDDFLIPIEKAVKLTREERDKTLEFISSYKSNDKP